MLDKLRGFSATNAAGNFNNSATTSARKGTEPIIKLGRSATTSRISSFQQSPTRAKRPTGAMSPHHLLTPTKLRRAPIANKIEVALGASETIRSSNLTPRRPINPRVYSHVEKNTGIAAPSSTGTPACGCWYNSPTQTISRRQHQTHPGVLVLKIRRHGFSEKWK